MNPEVNRNILIAVDASENSRRAVQYVAGMLGGMKGFKATVLSCDPGAGRRRVSCRRGKRKMVSRAPAARGSDVGGIPQDADRRWICPRGCLNPIDTSLLSLNGRMYSCRAGFAEICNACGGQKGTFP